MPTSQTLINIFLVFSLIVIITTFIIGVYYKNPLISLSKLGIQLGSLLIIYILLGYINQVKYGNIIIWIIFLLVILNSISQLYI